MNMTFKRLCAMLMLSALMMGQCGEFVVRANNSFQANLEVNETKADELFVDKTFTKLKEGVTQSKINSLKQEAEKLSDGLVKTETMVRLNHAESLLQEFTFKGLGDGVFATFVYYADGSNQGFFTTRNGQPHSYISGDYLTFVIKDDKGNEVFKKELKGNVSNSFKVDEVTLKEGYSLIINKTEPNRFDVNHEKLKFNNYNPYEYIVRDNQLVRIHDQNRYYDIKNSDDELIATLKVDYNANQVFFETFANENSKVQQKIVIKDVNGKVLLDKELKGNTKASSEVIDFRNNTTIDFDGNANIVASDDLKANDPSFRSSQEVNALVINRDNVYNKTSLAADYNEVYAKSFEKMIGKENLEEFTKESSQHADLVKFLYESDEAIPLFMSAGNASDKRNGTMTHFGYSNCLFSVKNELEALDILAKIIDANKDAKSGINLKIAIAIAKEFTCGMGTWLQNKDLDPLTRYKTFAKSYADGKLLADFELLQVSDMRNVVNVLIPDDEIEWLRNYMEEKHPQMIKRGQIERGFSLLVYRDKNPETGASIHGPNFYGENPTIEEVLKFVGVCGTMSKFSATLAQIYGIPAFAVGQPGHCAYQFLNSNFEYSLGYDVGGWKSCGNYNSTLPYLKLHLYFDDNNELYKQSEYYRHKGLISENQKEKENYLYLAMGIMLYNYQAWEDYLACVSDDVKEYNRMCEQAKEIFKDYPVIVERLTNQNLKDNIKNIYTNDKLDVTLTQSRLVSYQNQLDALYDGAYKDEYQSIIDKSKDQLFQLTTRGLGDCAVMDLNFFNDGSGRLVIDVKAGVPHSYFQVEYNRLEVYNNNKLILTKSLVGNQRQSASNELYTLKEGAKVVLTLKEKRFTSSDEELKKDALVYTFVLKDGKWTLSK